MSTPEGENKDGCEWPTLDNVVFISPERLALERYKRAYDEQADAHEHAGMANQFRDEYMKRSDAESLGRALHHYKAAMRGAEKEPLLQAWIVCHRANLYIHDLQSGKALLSDLAAELDLAQDLLLHTHTLRHRTFKACTLGWIDQTRAAFIDKPEVSQATQADMPNLRLVGGTAIEAAVLSIPEPGPEAA